MCGRINTITLLIAISLMLSICPPVSGDIAAEPAGGIASDGNHQTYLKNVFAYLNIDDISGNGTGHYTVYNPSNETEYLTICFDPGSERRNVSVMVNGIIVDSHEGYITTEYFRHWMQNETYYGTVFNITVLPKSFSNITIRWNFSVYNSKIIPPIRHTWYDARYKIIGYTGWNHSIDTVDITFRLNSTHFNEIEVWGRNETIQEINNVTTVDFHYTDFYLDEDEIRIYGDSYRVNEEVQRYYYYTLMGIIGVVLIGSFYYQKRRSKTPKDPTEPMSHQ